MADRMEQTDLADSDSDRCTSATKAFLAEIGLEIDFEAVKAPEWKNVCRVHAVESRSDVWEGFKKLTRRAKTRRDVRKCRKKKRLQTPKGPRHVSRAPTVQCCSLSPAPVAAPAVNMAQNQQDNNVDLGRNHCAYYQRPPSANSELNDDSSSSDTGRSSAAYSSYVPDVDTAAYPYGYDPYIGSEPQDPKLNVVNVALEQVCRDAVFPCLDIQSLLSEMDWDELDFDEHDMEKMFPDCRPNEEEKEKYTPK